ncbi:MAG: hypothetical protein ICV63_17150 [Coleofasciculus sp. Co-bin14]|nr:hypothetical protein [Coleofasciculus sp. Co-bin14]
MTSQGGEWFVKGILLSSQLGERDRFLICSTADFTVVKPIDLDVLAYGCDRVGDYLRTNQEVQQRDTPDGTQGQRHLCDGIGDR